MSPIDIPAIERRARQLRAEEIRRVEGLVVEQLRLVGRLMAATVLGGVLAIVAQVRPLFSRNPEVHHHL